MPKIQATVEGKVDILNSKTQDGSILYGYYNRRQITVVKSNGNAIPEALLDSQNVIKYHGETKDGAYRLFDGYFCTLRELIIFSKYFASGQHTRTAFLEYAKQTLDYEFRCNVDQFLILRDFRFVDSKKRPTSEGIGIIRDIIYSLYALYREKLCHGALSTDNIVICISDGKFTAKLTRVEGDDKESDYTNLSEVLIACFKLDGTNDANIREVLDLYNLMNDYSTPSWGFNHGEWSDFLQDTRARFYSDPRSLLKNILFLTSEECMTFISYFRMLLDACGKHQDKPAAYKFRMAVQGIRISKNGINVRWDSLFPPDMQTDVAKGTHNSTYNTWEKHDLIRYIRNCYFHLEDKGKWFKKLVGAPPVGFYDYFRDKFPDLLLDIHRLLQFRFAEVQREISFSYQFEAYLVPK